MRISPTPVMPVPVGRSNAVSAIEPTRLAGEATRQAWVPARESSQDSANLRALDREVRAEIRREAVREGEFYPRSKPGPDTARQPWAVQQFMAVAAIPGEQPGRREPRLDLRV